MRLVVEGSTSLFDVPGQDLEVIFLLSVVGMGQANSAW